MNQLLLHAFPQRPIRLKPARSRLGGWLGILVGLLIIGGTGGLMGFVLGPPIWSDYQVRNSAIAGSAVRMESGRCRTRMLLIHDCDLTLRYAGKGSQVTRQVNYIFVAPGSGNFTVQARVDPMRPEALTSDLGIDYLWNRAATAAALSLAGLLLGIVVIAASRAAGREARAARDLAGRNLVPVPVQLVRIGAGARWTVRDELGNSFEWAMGSKDQPLVVDPGRALVVALRETPGGAAYPVDDKLRRVDLTDAERHRIWAARDGVLANARPG